jgi:hypothetical protein
MRFIIPFKRKQLEWDLFSQKYGINKKGNILPGGHHLFPSMVKLIPFGEN